MADVLHDRLLAKVDWKPTRINSLTASSPQAIKIPLHFPTDRECLEVIMPTVGRVDLSEVTFGWMTNTLEIAALKLSENLRREIANNPLLEITGPAEEFNFDAVGDLPKLSFADAPAVAVSSH